MPQNGRPRIEAIRAARRKLRAMALAGADFATIGQALGCCDKTARRAWNRIASSAERETRQAAILERWRESGRRGGLAAIARRRERERREFGMRQHPVGGRPDPFAELGECFL